MNRFDFIKPDGEIALSLKDELITPIGKTLTVKGLIDKLKDFPLNMPVCDDDVYPITDVKEYVWENSNYPYDRPDCKFIKVTWKNE